jgi:hypothetical protein
MTELIDREEARLYDHFSIVPFKAVCGADIPNQSTTQFPERAKCATCWFYWNEFIKSYRSRLSTSTVTEGVGIVDDAEFTCSHGEKVLSCYEQNKVENEEQNNLGEAG